MSVASVKYVNQEYLARTSGIMSAASIAAMPVLSFIISGLVSFVTTAQCFIFAGVCALLECIWILKNKGIEGKYVKNGSGQKTKCIKVKNKLINLSQSAML